MSRNSQGKSNPSNSVPTSSSSATNTRTPASSSATNKKTPAVKPNPRELRDTFLQKIEFCSQTFDFNDDTKDTNGKNERLKYLGEICELFNDQSIVSGLILPHLAHLMELIEKNLFRPLPVVEKAETEDPEGSEASYFPPSWPHLQPVFELFLQIILNDQVEPNLLRKFITQVFVQEFLELFDSEISIKREYAKNVLHRLYAKVVPRRKMIRKAITDCFYTLIHENYKLHGAPELLDIMASIISGFAVPLREEHVYFFKTVIIPLHKVQTCQLYHEQLLRCSMLFLSKDPSLSTSLVEGLLKFWPFGNSAKETAFLTELLEVLEVCDKAKLEPLIPRLFKRLIKCISGPQLQVADRAMCYFENDYFLSLVKTYKNQTFPLLVPVICAIADTHWHKVLQESLHALKTILKEMDPTAFEKALSNKDKKTLYLVQDPTILKRERAKIDEKWSMLTKQAQLKNLNFQEPIIPYTDTHIVGEFNGLNNGNISF